MILYIGNNIKSATKNITTIVLLSKLLEGEGYDVIISSSKKNQLLRMLDMLFSVIKYRKTVDYIFIDTYSTKNFYYAFLTSQLSRILNLKYIPILHGGKLPSRLETSKMMSDLIFKNSYKNVAPSNYLKRAFEAKGYPTEFIPNILDINDYQFKHRTNFEPKLLYVRAFDQLYNPQMAIKVLGELKKNYPSAKLCMVGPDKDGSLQDCKDLTRQLKLEDSVEFTGKLSKQDWLNLAVDYDIFINTTNYDNTPISVMEAMALGLVNVSTNVGGIPYLLTDNFDGVLIEKDNSVAMAKAIDYIISNPQKAEDMIINARSKAEQFDWGVVKRKWHELLGDI